ncbi:MAG: FtsW/RodA/SpoVE family cell cycle protein [Dehalococcoidia bacterium]|nr:FtsW/RodA/SpoVE family cell cycle protein [Dehalococcoidia bacterium]
MSEASLLVIPGLLVLAGLSLLRLANGEPVDLQALLPGLLFVALIFFLHLTLELTGFKGDQILFPLSAALSGLGLVMVHRLSSPDTALKQTIWLAVGVLCVAMTLLVVNDTGRLRRYKYTYALVGFLLVAATFILGKDVNGSGARLWFSFGLFHFQPSEILKVLLVIFFAAYLDEYREILSLGHYKLGPLVLPPIPYLMPLAVMWLLALGLLTIQRDLGAALLFFGVFLSMLYIGSERLTYVLIGLPAFAVAAVASYHFVSTVQHRVDTWLDPWSQAAGSSYQIVQGLIALGSGGLLGSGLGFGQPTWIPAVHTDFVLAAIGEEMGLLGATAVLALYMLLCYRGYRIAIIARDSFDRMLAAGLTTVVAVQTIVIVAGTLKLIPLTGITLPFISYGGSSLVTNFIIVGLLMRISHKSHSRRGQF